MVKSTLPLTSLFFVILSISNSKLDNGEGIEILESKYLLFKDFNSISISKSCTLNEVDPYPVIE